MNAHPALPLSRPVVIAGLVIASGLALAAGGFSIFSTQEMIRTNERSRHFQDTLNQIGRVQSAVVEAETAQRGYLITGDADYLEPFAQAETRFGQEVAALRNLVDRDAGSLPVLKQVEQTGAQKFGEMEHMITLRKNHQTGAAINVLESDRDLDLMEDLRGHLGQLTRETFANLAESASIATRRASLFQNTGLGFIVLAVTLGIAGAIVLFQRIRAIEAIIPVCAWTHRVRHEGRWISFEQYLQERFDLRFTHGISEEAVEALKQETTANTTPPARIYTRRPAGVTRARASGI